MGVSPDNIDRGDNDLGEASVYWGLVALDIRPPCLPATIVGVKAVLIHALGWKLSGCDTLAVDHAHVGQSLDKGVETITVLIKYLMDYYSNVEKGR